jgi:hypothetical protein
MKIWKEVPWEDNPGSKTTFDYLMDILCDIPGLLEDVDGLSSLLQGVEEATILDTKMKVLGCLEQLNLWWRGWASRNPHGCHEYTSENAMVTVDDQGPLYPTLLRFNSFWDSVRKHLLADRTSVLNPPSIS